MVFSNSGSIDLEQYVSDYNQLKLRTMDTAITYGTPNYPQLLSYHVTPAGLYDLNSAKDVKLDKSLSFTFTSISLDNTGKSSGRPGANVDSVYVDTKPLPDAKWAVGEPLPQSPDPTAPYYAVYTEPNNPANPSGDKQWIGHMLKPVPVQEWEADGTPKRYYVHVRATDNAVQNVQVDVQSPISEASCGVSRGEKNGVETYTFTALFSDKAPTGSADYTAAGLYQSAWYLGDDSIVQPEVAKEALANSMEPFGAFRRIGFSD